MKGGEVRKHGTQMTSRLAWNLTASVMSINSPTRGWLPIMISAKPTATCLLATGYLMLRALQPPILPLFVI